MENSLFLEKVQNNSVGSSLEAAGKWQN